MALYLPDIARMRGSLDGDRIEFVPVKPMKAARGLFTRPLTRRSSSEDDR